MKCLNLTATQCRLDALSLADVEEVRAHVNAYGCLALFGYGPFTIEASKFEDRWFIVSGDSGAIASLDTIVNHGPYEKLLAGRVTLTLEQRVDRIEGLLGL